MVAIITGRGVGLERSSALVLGSRGQVGSAEMGRDGEGVFVNAANGNLVITRQDEFLIGLGPDISIDRTYNSQATVSDGDNNDNWRMSPYRKVTGLSGTYAAAGTTVKRIDWDGSETLYSWNAAENAYLATDGAGAYDKLTRSGSVWTWTDGDSQCTESYDDGNGGRITAALDTDGNSVVYTYNGSGQISRITSNNAAGTGDDDYTDFTYTGTLLTQLVTTKAGGGALTRVRYAYLGDGTNRLSTVTVDLSPDDNAIADGKTYVTTYSYDGSSNRVASITQLDGSSISFSYVEVGADFRVASFTQTVAAGISRSTMFDYSVANRTTVTDPAGQKTILWYNANNELTQISYPPEDPNTTPRVVQFGYDVSGDGDVTSVAIGPGNVITYDYDTHGNRKLERDSAGNTIVRTFSAKNELLTETRYLAPDPDGAGAGQPATPVTTRYAYDSESHLRYVVSAEGFVTQYEYNAAGRRTAANEYVANAYPVAGLADNASIAESTLTSWVSALDKTGSRRTETGYDYRGNVATVTSYSKLQPNGLFDTSSERSQTNYVYDQYGKLLSRTVTGSAGSEVFTYDGLGRQTMATDFNGGVTTVAFNDSGATTIVTLASGLRQISTYNRAGERIFYTETDNLLPNPQFLNGTDGWTLTNVQRVAGGAGDSSPFYVQHSGGAGNGQISMPWYVPAPAASTVYLSFQAKPTAAGQQQFQAGIYWYDAAGNYVTGAVIDRWPTDTTSFTTYEAAIGKPANATSYLVYVLGQGGSWGAARLATTPLATATPTARTEYRYDALGRLRMTIDPTGRANYMLYDSIGRKVADVDTDGSITEYRYDGNDNLTSSTRYATRLSAAQLLSLAVFDTGNAAPVTSTTGSALLTNGSFDTSGSYTATATGRANTDLPGWTKVNPEAFEQVTAGQLGVTGTDGGFWLDLDSVPGSGTLPTGPNLLLNGSFDTSGSYTTTATGRSNTSLPNWTKTNAENFEQVTSGQMGVTATDGTYWLDLDSVAGSGQLVATGSNLVLNPSFETSAASYTSYSWGRSSSTLPNWTKANGQDFEQVATGNYGVSASNGSYWLDLDSIPSTLVTVGGNLLLNPSFETVAGGANQLAYGYSSSTLPYWTKANNELFEQVVTGNFGVYSSDGSYWLDMDSVPGPGTYAPTGPNLLVNGSFDISGNYLETSSGRANSTLPGWTKANAESFEQVSGLNNTIQPSDGGFWLDMDSVSGGVVPLGDNLIVNGSFETSGSTYTTTATGRLNTAGIPGWTRVSSQTFEQTNAGVGGVSGTTGSYYLDMEASGNADISQTVTGLTSGQQLLISFDYANVAGTVLDGEGNPDAGGSLQVFWNGTQIAWIANPSSTMTTKSYTVTATGTTGTLRFKEVGGSNGVGVSIDNVKVTRTQSAPATGGNMDISQTVGGLTAGQVLQLQFDHANRTTAASGSFEVYWNGALLATYNSTGYTMVTETLSVTAIAGNNVLRFKGTGSVDALGAALDNVRLYATSYIPNGGNMDISQSVSGLTAGQVMRLQFDHANRTTSGSGSFNVYWNGNLVAQVTSTGTTMVTDSYDIVAIAGTNTLRFLGTGTVDANGASLDNVRLFATQATPNGGNMDISQAISGLTAGQTYMFQFDHANRTTSASGSFDVYWNTTLIASITSTGTTMVSESYNVVAAAGANTIRFVGTGTTDAAGASIDNVRLFATQVDVGGGNMDISQAVSGLAAGQTYQLQFDHANRTTAASGSFEVYWNTTLIATITSTGTTMLAKSYNVVAQAGTNTVRFKGTGTVDANGASIDNVRLYATTTPVGGGNMDISQNVPGLAAGQIVQLQFNHANRTTAASGSFEVYWNNNLVATVTDTGTAMQTKTFRLAAIGGTNTLRFKGTGTVDAVGASIDNVRLYATSTTFSAASLGAKVAAIRPLANANDVWNFQVYDLAQRLVQTIDGTGATTVYAYDGASRLTSTTSYANRLDAATLASLKASATNPNRWNLNANGQPLSLYNLSAAAAGTIDGANAFQLTVGAGTDWQTVYTDGSTLSPGQVASATITVKAVGSVTTDSFGLYGATSGWGPDSDAYATIVSGPGQLTYQYGGFFMVSGLSTTEATRITVTRTYRMSEWASPYFYLNNTTTVPGQATIIAAPVFSTASSPLLPAADAANDRVSRSFYDNDGRLIGTLDGEGYLSQIVYDKGGSKIQTIAYSGPTSASLRAAGTFSQLLASVTIDNSKDIRNHFVYDSRGMLRATVDGEGGLTRYNYFPLGDVAQVISGQKLDPVALIATPPTFPTLPAAPAGTILQTISYTRDLYGKVLTETASLTGAATTTTAYAYDVMGRLVATTTQSGGADPRTASQRFDLRGRLTGALGGIGNASLPANPTQAQIDQAYASYGVSYAYDAADRMTSSTDARGARTLYYYDTDGRLAFQVDPLGEVAEYRYDALGRRTDTIVYANRIAAAALAGMTGGNVTAAVATTMAQLANATFDTASHVDFEVDDSIKQSIDPLGNVSTYGYNAFGEISSDIVPRDGAATIQTSRIYDRRGLLKTEIVDSAAGGKAISTSYGYDAFGRAITLTNALTKTVGSTYDRKGRLVTQTQSPDGGTTVYTATFTYDARDNLVAVTDALNKITRYVYDKANRRIATIDALGGVTTTSYDADGRAVATRAYYNVVSTASLPLEVTESALALPGAHAADQITRYAYDKDGRLRFVVDALMHVVENVYDVAGNVIRTVAYDGTIAVDGTGLYSATWIAGQVAGLAGTRTERSVYDLANRRIYAVDAIGQVTWSSYDAKGQLIKQVELAALYTAAGDPSLATMDSWRSTNSSADDRTSRAYYDRKGRLAYSIDALGYVTRLEYDKLGNVKKQTRYADAYSATDSTTLTNLDASFASPPATARATQFNYDSAGRLEETIDPEGYSTKLVLDALGQVTSSTAAFGLGAASVTTYSYDDVGRVKTETRGYGAPEASVTAFDYDALGRLTQRTAASGTADASITKWDYDELGRVKKQTRGLGTAEAAETQTFYDAFGRVTSIVDPRGSTVSRTYTVLDQLQTETEELEAGTADDRTTTYTYDSFGNAVKVRDARGNDSFAYFDKLGRVQRRVDAEKYVTDTSYTRGGQVWTVKRWANAATGTIVETSMPADPAADIVRDAVTTFTYNKRDQLTAVQDAQGYTESYTLNAFGERIEVRNKLHGSVVNGVTLDTTAYYTFDKRGLVKSETLPITTKTAGGATISVVNSYDYDARGNRTRMTEAEGAAEARTTNYFYDKLDRLYQTTHDAVTVVNSDLTSSAGIVPTETVKYDRRGNVIETVDAGGARTLFWYDDLDRAIAQVSQTEKIGTVEKGTLTRTAYDGNGNATSVTIYGTAVVLPSQATDPIPGGDPSNYRLTTYTYYRDNRLKESIVAALTTGEWNGSSYVLTPGLAGGAPNPAAQIKSLLEYDQAGNVVHQEDGRGNDIWSWYDKLGRKTAEVDAENYLTVWSRDAEGNALSETRYATRLTSFTPGSPTPPSVGSSAADRTTSFEYDRNGRRIKEVRLAVAYTAIDPVTGAATDVAATDPTAKSTITYSYNGLGEVLTRTEAAGATTNSYDTMGRLTLEVGQSFTDHQGASVAPRTAYAYDGLNNVRTVRSQLGATANDSSDRITTFTYGAGGRLATMTDAADFTHSYGYDAAGRRVLDSYARLRSDGTTITEAQVTRYDLAGRATVQTSARLSGATWLFTDLAGAAYDAIRLRYNAYGEISGRGLTAGPNAPEAYQEFFEYDGGGRLWKSNSGDGVLRFFVYDKSGNQTLTLAATTADLSTLQLNDYTSSITGSGDTSIAGAVTTLAVFDGRGQQIQTREPDRELAAGVSAVIVHARTYNAFGEVASETDGRGFDAAGNAISFTGGAGYTTTYNYNTMGRLLSKVSPQVSVTSATGAVANVNPTETYGYDLSGRLVSVIDANGWRTTRLLLAGSGTGDSEPLVLKEFHPDFGVFERRYDVFGAMRTSVNEIGKTETFLYDKMNRLVEQDHALRPAGSLGNTTGADIQLKDFYAYDGLGQRIQHWNSQLTASVKETTDYDAQGRVTGTVAFGGDSTAYSYVWNALQGTNGLGTFGGWTKSTIGPDGRSPSETLDYFGRTVDRVDSGQHDYDLTFDKGGRLISQGTPGAATTTMTWYNTGLLATKSANGLTAVYGYDENGRRKTESYGGYQNASVTWDAMGRMISFTDTGMAGGAAPATITYAYDAVGNVRRMTATYANFDAQGVIFGTGYPQEYWYSYDMMNRFTVTKGSFSGTPGSGAIVGGTQISYDAAGNRATVTQTVSRTKLLHRYVPSLGTRTPRYYDDDASPITPDDNGGTWSDVQYQFYSGQVETYSYTADGYLAGVSVAVQDLLPTGDLGKTNPQVGPLGPSVQRGSYEVDAMGRVTAASEYNPSGVSVYSRSSTYNAKSQLTHDVINTSVANSSGGIDLMATTTDYYYTTLGGVYLGGAVDRHVAATTKGGTLQSTVTTTNSYDWWDGPRQSAMNVFTDYVSGTDTNYTSTYSYDAAGHLSSVYAPGGRARTVTFVTDVDGRVIDRDEEDNQPAGGDPRELHYYFNGIELGGVTNNGTTDVDYISAIAMHTAAPGTGPFRGGSANSTNYVDFDQSYDPINGLNSASTGASYTINPGDTLQSIAQNLWGDAALWYLIADANGLTAGSSLAAGATLSIPNKVTNIHNSADTFRVYDPNKALGDLNPTAPKPPKAHKGCGVLGAILLVAIAVAVTIVTSGAAIAALSPAVTSVGMGISVVMGTAAAGVTAGVGLGTMIVAGAVGGAVGSIVSQGVGVATGLQDKFSWKGVAMSALSGAIGAGLGKFAAMSKVGSAGPGLAKIKGTLGQIGQFLGKSNFVSGAVRGVISSGLAQGIGVATGLQKKFDWVGVAAAGVAGGVSSEIGGHLRSWDPNASQLVSGAAGALANAATRTVLNGSDFGDNLLAALPDVIGTTLGNMIAGSLAAPVAAPASVSAPARTASDAPQADNEIVISPGLARALERAFPPFELEPIQLPDLNPTGDPAIAAILREARAGAMADDELRRRAIAAGVRNPLDTPSAASSSTRLIQTHAAGGIEAGLASSEDRIGWLVENANKDVPLYLRDNRQAYPNANDPAFHQQYATLVVNQAIMTGRYFDIERIILPAALRWAERDPNFRVQAEIYQRYVNERTALANTASNQILFAGVLAPAAIGGGGAAGVTLLAGEGLGLWSLSGTAISLDYGQAHARGLLNGSFEMQSTGGGWLFGRLSNGRYGEGAYALFSLTHAFSALAASRLGSAPGASASELSGTVDNLVPPPATARPDFYVTPEGVAVPSTGYRVIGTPQGVADAQAGLIPVGRGGTGTYVTFDNITTLNPADTRSLLQLPQLPTHAAPFDTLDHATSLIVPREYQHTGLFFEPLTVSYPNFGAGGGTQALTPLPINNFPVIQLPRVSTQTLPQVRVTPLPPGGR